MSYVTKQTVHLKKFQVAGFQAEIDRINSECKAEGLGDALVVRKVKPLVWELKGDVYLVGDMAEYLKELTMSESNSAVLEAPVVETSEAPKPRKASKPKAKAAKKAPKVKAKAAAPPRQEGGPPGAPGPHPQGVEQKQ